MKRGITAALCLVVALMFSACSKKTATSQATPVATTPGNTSTPGNASSTPQTSQPATEPGALQVGQASGSYTAKGKTVELKYAYAGRGERFGMESIIVLVTDKPIPADAISEEIKSQKLLLAEEILGLEYVLDKESMWVRFHPGQYQESSSNKLKEYTVEGDVVRGVDDNDGNLTDGKYSRKVKFVAAIVK